jgi:hypothetical protein
MAERSAAAAVGVTAYVSIRQHASACVSIRQHTNTSANASMRQHTQQRRRWCQQGGFSVWHACAAIYEAVGGAVVTACHPSAYVSIRQHPSAVGGAVVTACHPSAYVSIRQHPSAVDGIPVKNLLLPVKRHANACKRPTNLACGHLLSQLAAKETC